MTRRQFFGVVFLVGLVVASAIGDIYLRHVLRMDFRELQSLRAEQDQLELDWYALLLEQQTWETYGRVVEIAQKKLQMSAPRAQDVVVIRP